MVVLVFFCLSRILGPRCQKVVLDQSSPPVSDAVCTVVQRILSDDHALCWDFCRCATSQRSSFLLSAAPCSWPASWVGCLGYRVRPHGAAPSGYILGNKRAGPATKRQKLNTMLQLPTRARFNRPVRAVLFTGKSAGAPWFDLVYFELCLGCQVYPGGVSSPLGGCAMLLARNSLPNPFLPVLFKLPSLVTWYVWI